MWNKSKLLNRKKIVAGFTAVRSEGVRYEKLKCW